MGELKLKISNELERKFREYALKRYGYKKGALSAAAEDALSETIKKGRPDKNRFFGSAGGWRDVNADSLVRRIYENRTSTRRKVEL
ncbi:MAG: hypothetical protein HY516_03825 [Candidatus Aenigmarchaeota archaeon]|nr:hypothetical protein [Candidatus Aenigmarchaeota archaeon]